jgi:hypothetical protein
VPISSELRSSPPRFSNQSAETVALSGRENTFKIRAAWILARPATIPRARVAETGQKQNLINKTHIAFSRITQTMRSQRFPTREQRETLLASARAFHERFPADPRSAQLLTEVATRFDGAPSLKASILEEAQRLSRDPQLHLRIKDDLKRTALFGKTLRFSIKKAAGGMLKIEALQGAPVVVLYFSEESIPSLVAWESLNEGLREHSNIQRVAICLDKKPNALTAVSKEYGANWTICWDGLGWSSPIARDFGINAVPTAWLVDGEGRLQSLNILEDLPRQLLELEQRR